jgi:hypothetical protein
MSTRSNIGILNNDGSISYVYCHFDGYPSNVGAILLQKYDTEEKVRALIAQGNMSSLGDPNRLEVEPEFYTSRGEELEVYQTDDIEAMKERDFSYLYDTGENAWYYSGFRGIFTNLKPEVCGIINKEEKTSTAIRPKMPANMIDYPEMVMVEFVKTLYSCCYHKHDELENRRVTVTKKMKEIFGEDYAEVFQQWLKVTNLDD